MTHVIIEKAIHEYERVYGEDAPHPYDPEHRSAILAVVMIVTIEILERVEREANAQRH